MKTFKNKVAVVTGAASGIGKSLARHCAENGMKIALADVEKDALSATEAGLKAAGADVTAVLTDVSVYEDVRALAQETMSRYGRVDLLFNNAGVAAGGALWECSLNDCKWVINVNLWGMIHCIREFVPLMLSGVGPGHIVNTASIAGVSTYHPSALYHLTKHALVALSEQLYHDLALRGSQIKVSVLCPGFVNTNIMDADRNRPDMYRDDPADPLSRPGTEDAEKIFADMIRSGMPPRKVAHLVFDAIKSDRFFIFTHPETAPLIRSRMEDMVGGRNPVLPPLEGPLPGNAGR